MVALLGSVVGIMVVAGIALSAGYIGYKRGYDAAVRDEDEAK